MDFGPGRGLSGRFDAHEVARHGAPRRQAMNDPTAALDLVLDRVAEVREGLLQGDRRLLEALAGRGDARHRSVLDVIWREDLVDEPELVVVEDLERQPLHPPPGGL